MNKVAIDLETYFRNVSGIHTYIAELVGSLVRIAPDVSFTLFASSDYAEEMRRSPLGKADNLEYRPLARRHRTNRLAYFVFGASAVEDDIGTHDLYHSPTTPGFATHGCYVVTVHDLTWRRYKKSYPRRTNWMRDIGLRRDLKRARRIVADSEATRRDLAELAGVDPHRVRVVHLGVSDRFVPERDPDAVRRTLDALHVRRPYVLTLAGDHSPRKNLARLVRAMGRVRRRVAGVQLVVLGRAVFDTVELERAIREEQMSEAVVRPGFIAESDLLDVVAGARVMAFPSLYEGFGFPILEAMASGTPVVTSNVSSMPEVAGDAAILVDPSDEEAIASGIVRVIEDDGLYGQLRRKGLERASMFTWEKTARRTLEVYREAAT